MLLCVGAMSTKDEAFLLVEFEEKSAEVTVRIAAHRLYETIIRWREGEEP